MLRRFAGVGLAGVFLVTAGCASPGPPKAPSLQLPATVTKLEATRKAGVVELTFDVPGRTSDGVAYRGASVRARVCRAVETGLCLPVPSLTGVMLPVTGATENGKPRGGSSRAVSGTGSGAVSGAGSGAGAGAGQAKLEDVLPDSLATGPARLLTYRVELSNEKGKTAGFGEAAFAAAGAGPAAVAGLRAEGSRRGVAVRWLPAGGGGDVVLRRELAGGVPEGVAKKGKLPGAAERGGRGQGSHAKSAKRTQGEGGDKPGVVWLSTVPEADPLAPPAVTGGTAAVAKNTANGVLDDGAEVGGMYRYEAERRETVQLAGHALVLRGPLSAPVEVTLQAVYPPPAPRDLVGTAFPLENGGGMAVDLIWTPADDPGTVGYRVWREVGGVRTELTKDPVKMPAFHDALPAGVAGELTYRVAAVDAKGMESAAVLTVVSAAK